MNPGDAVYNLEDYFGISAPQLAAQDLASPQAPNYTAAAGAAPTGSPGVQSAFTEWRVSPTFWLALFAVFALGMVHLEGSVKAALR